MNPHEVPVCEPSAPLKFASARRRLEHAGKHVFELWQQEKLRRVLGLDSDLCWRARTSWQEGDRQTAEVRNVARAYENVCAQAILELCADPQNGHVHLVRYELPALQVFIDVGRDALKCTFQYVYAWAESPRLFLVAAQPIVPNRDNLPYHLKTGYRPDDRIDGGRFRAKARAWIRQLVALQPFKLLADHGG